MSNPDTPAQLAGHRFAGGTAVVERWEHVLFNFACGPDDVVRHDHVHPACAFHVPIRGAGTSVAELFDLVGADGPASVGIDRYEFDMPRPWRVGDVLRGEGRIAAVEPVTVAIGGSHRPADLVTFEFTLADDDGPVVVSRIVWWVDRPGRSVDDAATVVGPDVAGARDVDRGEPTATRTVHDVSADNMRLAAALFRDPYPIHWDAEASEAAGLGRRLVNQTPLNVAYVVDLLHDLHGVGSIRSLTLRFPGLVFAGDDVTALAWIGEEGSHVALVRKGRVVVVGDGAVND